jgi:hypothetical protein
VPHVARTAGLPAEGGRRIKEIWPLPSPLGPGVKMETICVTTVSSRYRCVPRRVLASAVAAASSAGRAW